MSREAEPRTMFEVNISGFPRLGNPIPWPFFFFFSPFPSSLANKKPSLLLKGRFELPGNVEYSTDRHVRHHEWTAHGDITTLTGSKMVMHDINMSFGHESDTSPILNLRVYFDIFKMLHKQNVYGRSASCSWIELVACFFSGWISYLVP